MPKTLEIEQFSDLSPDELEAALKDDTRFSLFPYQGSPLVGNVRLKGRVKKDKVKVGLTKRDWWTFLQPIFQGRIEPVASGGSKLVGTAGMPMWIVWYMRIASAVFVPLAILAAAWPLLSEAGTQGMVMAAVFTLVAVLGTVLGVGLNVSHAEKQLPELEATLASISGSTAPLGDGVAQSVPAAEDAETEGNSMKGRHSRRARSLE